VSETIARVATPRAQDGRSLTRGGIALVLNSGSTAILGVGYWVVAARLYNTGVIGRSSAIVAALLTVSGFAQLNFARSLSGLIPRAGRRAPRLLARVYLATGIVSVVLGAGFAVIAPAAAASLHYLRDSSLFVPGFLLATIAWTVFTLEDTALASVRRAEIVPFENAAFGVMKIALLVIFERMGFGALGIFASWVVPLALVVPVINWYLFRHALPRNPTFTGSPEDLKQPPRVWVRYDFAGYLFWVLGTLPLPLFIAIQLGPVAAAVFYVPFRIVVTLDVMSLNVGNAFTAELQRDRGRLNRRHARFLFRLWGMLLVVTAGLALTAPYVLELFGKHYRHGGQGIFFLLLAAVVPRSVMFLAIAAARAAGRGPTILAIQATACVGTLVLGVVFASRIGVIGLGWGWLIASIAAGAVGAVSLLNQSVDHAASPVAVVAT
jgi:O-antigen/teichoic acid export membrane protein